MEGICWPYVRRKHMKKENNPTCSLIISSCKKYEDLWFPHIDLLRKNWSSCEFDVTIVTDFDTSSTFQGIRIFAAGDIGVPQRLLKYLDSSYSDYIFLTLDDYFLTKPINNDDIIKIIILMDSLNLDYLRLYKHPIEHKTMKECKDFKTIKYNDNYKVNLYPGIWKRDFLLYTLKKNTDIWKYEAMLTKYAIEYNARSAVTKKNVFPFLDVMRQGYVLHKAYKYCKKCGYVINHDLIPWKKEIKRNIKFYAKEIMPIWFTKFIKRIMIHLGHKYISEVNVEDN